MSSRATRIAVAVLVVFVAMTARARLTAPRTAGSPPPPSVVSEASDRDAVVVSEEIDAVDAYGNEVTRAVATYQFDATGSLYELHSPRTEVPKLPAPKS